MSPVPDETDAVAVVAHSRGPEKRVEHCRAELEAAVTLAKESVASLKYRSNRVKIEDTRVCRL